MRSIPQVAPGRRRWRCAAAVAGSLRAIDAHHPRLEQILARGAGRDRYKWLISDAIDAAPKPLSMFTTDTPDAQLLSMPSSAAIPPKLAP